MFSRLGALKFFSGPRRTSRLSWIALILTTCGYLLTLYVVQSAKEDMRVAQAQSAESLLERTADHVKQHLFYFEDLLHENSSYLDGDVPRALAISRLCGEYFRQAKLHDVSYIGFIPAFEPESEAVPVSTLCRFEDQRIRQERIDWHAFTSPADWNDSPDMKLLWGIKNRQTTEKLGINEAVMMFVPVYSGPEHRKTVGYLMLLAKANTFGSKLLDAGEDSRVYVQAWPQGASSAIVASYKTPVATTGALAGTNDKNVIKISRTFDIDALSWRFEATYQQGFGDLQLQKSLQIISWGGMLLSTALGLVLLLVGASLQPLEQFLMSLRMRLTNSEQFSHDIVSNLAEGVYTTDLSGRITFINPEACRLLGYEMNELLFHNDHRLFHKAKAVAHPVDDACLLLKSICRGEVFESDEEFFTTKEGRDFPVAVVASPIVRAFRTIGMVVSFRDVSQEQMAQHEIWWRANFDKLTRLPNRNLFFDRLRQDISRTIRNKEILGLLFIDLDGFKLVNDSYGHDVGDLLLAEVAGRITRCVRESDTVARLGGDEFTVTLVRQVDAIDIERVAEKIRLSVAEPVQINDLLLRVSASIGVAICPTDAMYFDELLSLADNAMYESKRLGKNCIQFSSLHLRDRAVERQMVLDELRQAIDGTLLTFQLQPILRLDDGKVCKAEMLVRWDHPERGHIPPSHFVQIAEQTGAIVQLGDLVFSMGVRWLAEHQAQLPADFQLSINVSPIQFQVNPGKAQEWLALLDALGISSGKILIEITESALLVNDTNVHANLECLKTHGVSLALDDFGSGYSSMANLRHFDIDFIKVDQQFVQRMVQDVSERSITEGIVSLAHRLGISVVAEGVESLEQAELLKQMHCEYLQGYWVAMPLWPAEFSAFMQRDGQFWPSSDTKHAAI